MDGAEQKVLPAGEQKLVPGNEQRLVPGALHSVVPGAEQNVVPCGEQKLVPGEPQKDVGALPAIGTQYSGSTLASSHSSESTWPASYPSHRSRSSGSTM